MNRNVTICSVFLLKSFDYKRAPDRAVFGKDLVGLQPDDFTNSKSGIDAYRDNRAIAGRLNKFEYVLNIFFFKNGGFSGH